MEDVKNVLGQLREFRLYAKLPKHAFSRKKCVSWVLWFLGTALGWKRNGRKRSRAGLYLGSYRDIL